jgi:hypothetical protein
MKPEPGLGRVSAISRLVQVATTLSDDWRVPLHSVRGGVIRWPMRESVCSLRNGMPLGIEQARFRRERDEIRLDQVPDVVDCFDRI